jgi:hypothetical protein
MFKSAVASGGFDDWNNFRSKRGAVRTVLSQIVYRPHFPKDEGVARAEGKYKSWKPTARAKSDQILELDCQGLSREAIAKQVLISVCRLRRHRRLHN